MDRLFILQTLMKKKRLRNYLEIGVSNAHTFFKIKSNFKIAVDPEFRFDFVRKAGKTLLNPSNLLNNYVHKTSDDFFAQDAATLIGNRKIDVSLIDGMHEYAYALRDVENTLEYLSDDGVIIMHDCNPLTAQAAISFADWKATNFAGMWSGDVWKTIVHLRSLRDDINVFVLDCDFGLGIITRKKPESRLKFNQDQVMQLSYEEFDRNRKEWLNLKPENYFFEYFDL
ncbi:MAG TPA: class I SAM-dependent methyltransferase [Puia sp.]|nr:class I SAM-dependent methyltransferase [Puia sp.]